jgi:cytochrome c2
VAKPSAHFSRVRDGTKTSAERDRARFARRLRKVLLLVASGALAACHTGAPRAADDPAKGREAIAAIGCGSCHVIPGVAGAAGTVGPSLDGIATQAVIAGELSNTPANMLRWIVNPQAIEPGIAMPPLRDADDRRARNIVAYLYTLK